MRSKSKKSTIKKRKKIFSKKNSDILVSTISNKSDEDITSNSFQSEKLEINLNVDKKEFLLSNVGKVEVSIIEEPAEIFEKRKQFSKNISKKNTSMKSTNLKIKNINKIRRRNFKEKNLKSQKITEINPEVVIDTRHSSLKKIKSMPDSELFGTKTQIIARPIKEQKILSKKQFQIQKKFSENEETKKLEENQNIKSDLRKREKNEEKKRSKSCYKELKEQLIQVIKILLAQTTN